VHRATEADEEDSGFVDLHAVRSSVTPEQAARAESTELGSADLFDDAAGSSEGSPASMGSPTSKGPANDTGAVAAPSSAAGPTAAGPAAAGSAASSTGSSRNTWIGAAIGLAGIAAAVALWVNSGNGAKETARVDATHTEASPTGDAPAGKPAATSEAAVDEDEPGGLEVSDLDEPDDADDDDGDDPSSCAVAVGPGKSPPPAGGKKAGDDKDEDKPDEPGEEGDLSDEMAKAAGADDEDEGGEEPRPAAADPNAKGQSVPEAPPQGKVQAAIGSVLGGARACVAGGDDVSRATITFGSNGRVKSVSVSGWASGKGAAGCIKSALKGANVGRFARPSYTVGITVRP